MYEMKKIFFVLTIIVIAFNPLMTVLAQEQVNTNSESSIQEIIDPALQPSLEVLPQIYPEKTITIRVEIKALVSSGKVGVNWSYPENLLDIVGNETDIITVTNGNSTYLTKEFNPKPEAIIDGNDFARFIEIGTRVNAFIEDRNYLSATSIDLQVNNEMELIPMTTEYKNDKNVTLAIQWGIRVLIVMLVLGSIIFGIKKFIDYLNSPDQPKY